MTQENKKLLLKDLCARLPYHPQIKIYNDSWEGCQIGEFDNNLYWHHVEAFVYDRIEIEPYLRPMLSMTGDEMREIEQMNNNSIQHIDTIGVRFHAFYDTCYNEMYDLFDYLNAHHFDYRGLIEKGLALEAPSNMYE